MKSRLLLLGLLAGSLALSACGGDSGSSPSPKPSDTCTVNCLTDTACKTGCVPDTSCKVNCQVTPGPMGVAPYTALRPGQIDSAVGPIGGGYYSAGMAKISAKGKSFLMGLKDSIDPADQFAYPQRRIFFTYDFYLDKSEITAREASRVLNWAWRRNRIKLVVGSDGMRREFYTVGSPSEYVIRISDLGDPTPNQRLSIYGDTLETVSGQNFTTGEFSFKGAKLYANLRSEIAGLEPVYDSVTWKADYRKNGFRIPTEAEFEYALRAGTTTEYLWGDVFEVNTANNWGRSDVSRYPAYYCKPNAFALYDMIGGESEWLEGYFEFKKPSGGTIDPFSLLTDTSYVLLRSRGGGKLTSRSGYRTYTDAESVSGIRLILPIR